jgi:hypothetical protein
MVAHLVTGTAVSLAGGTTPRPAAYLATLSANLPGAAGGTAGRPRSRVGGYPSFEVGGTRKGQAATNTATKATTTKTATVMPTTITTTARVLMT